MKTITIIAEQVSDATLTAALPRVGICSVTVGPARASDRHAIAIEDFRGFRNPRRFNPAYRIDVVVEDSAVDSVFEGIAFAYGAGCFSDAEAWVNRPALALSA